MIEIRLFGHLRQLVPNTGPSKEAVLQLDENLSTIGQVLTSVGIGFSDVGNLFLNGRLLPRSAYPITLGYPMTATKPLTAAAVLSTPLQDGDRLGIFPRAMSLVVV